MVISLESQNVKIKRSINLGIKEPQFKVPHFNIKLPTLRVERIYIPFIVALFLFSIIFADGFISITPTYSSDVDLNSVVLPDHRADLVTREEILSYDRSVPDSYYTDVELTDGENISTIAINYGVSRESILHINNIEDVRKLYEHSTIRVPYSNGYLHKVSSRDSLESIGRKYDVPIEDIFRVNGLKSSDITVLDTLFIPGVDPCDWGWHSNLESYFVYPVNGYISKRYGLSTSNMTDITTLYEGLDFIPINDNSVYASKGGFVSRIGYSASYGHYLYIDHSGGTRTLYAHLDKIEVAVRDHISQGDIIGQVGSSGATTDLKLFFGLFSRDESVDPEKYLK